MIKFTSKLPEVIFVVDDVIVLRPIGEKYNLIENLEVIIELLPTLYLKRVHWSWVVITNLNKQTKWQLGRLNH